MNTLPPALSPASFVTVYTPRTNVKHTSANSILTELLIQGEPAGAYSMQVHALRERFNDMYYNFLGKLAIISQHGNLSQSQQESLHSLFEELLEIRTLLEKEPISTT